MVTDGPSTACFPEGSESLAEGGPRADLKAELLKREAGTSLSLSIEHQGQPDGARGRCCASQSRI